MLKVNVRNFATVTILCLQGRIVIGETDTLRDAVHSQSAGSAVSVVLLDLARINTVDAHGLGVLLELREHAEAKGIRFELMNVTKWVSRVLEISCLDSIFKITSGVEFFPSVSRKQNASVPWLASCA
jgi:anti-anti-sigma factor